MTDLLARFEAAAQQATELPNRPDNQTLLKLYALYKQATMGDVQGERPGFGDFVERAKFDAWQRLKGTAEADAMQSYIELVQKLRS